MTPPAYMACGLVAGKSCNNSAYHTLVGSIEGMIFVYSTVKDQAEAEMLAALLVERRLAACVNMWPIRSTYMSRNGVEKVNEYAILAQSTESKFQQIEDLIHMHHSERVPCVAGFEVRRINHEFKEWLVECLG